MDLTDEIVSNLKTHKVQEEFYDSAVTFRNEAGVRGSFGVRVSRTGKKVFFLVYNVAGKRKRLTLGSHPSVSLDFARERAKRELVRIRRGRTPSAHAAGSAPRTFGELEELYSAGFIPTQLAEQTGREYRRILRKELLPLWADREIDSIRPADVLHLVRRIREERGKSAMANRVRAVAASVFDYAITQLIIAKNPARGFRGFDEARQADRALTGGEISRMSHALLGEELPIRVLFTALLYTGQRLADVLGMRWTNIVFDTWVFQRAGAGETVGARRIPLAPALQSLLKELHAGTSEISAIDPSRYIFVLRGERPISYLRRASSRISGRMGGNITLRPRMLRRTVRDGLLELGFRPDVVDYSIGNSTLKSRLSAHPPGFDYERESTRALTAWADRLAALTGAPPPERKAKRAPKLSKPEKSGGKVIPLFE